MECPNRCNQLDIEPDIKPDITADVSHGINQEKSL